jgi:branched-chain amino acid aminotransferase
MTKSKVVGNYVNSMLVKTLAIRSGYDEAVILDPNGFVAECTGENLFILRRGTLITPPLAIVLEGLTRHTVITLAEDMGVPFREAMFTRDQLYTADEVFICGTAAEIVGAHAIDHRSIGEGRPGPITRALIKSYDENTHGKGRFSEQWLEYVK